MSCPMHDATRMRAYVRARMHPYTENILAKLFLHPLLKTVLSRGVASF